jgi:hypothetical protein
MDSVQNCSNLRLARGRDAEIPYFVRAAGQPSPPAELHGPVVKSVANEFPHTKYIEGPCETTESLRTTGNFGMVPQSTIS